MSPATPKPPIQPTLPPPVMSPSGNKPQKKPAQPSFISGSATPPSVTGAGGTGKTLLGQ
jgi:hypothetical protein